MEKRQVPLSEGSKRKNSLADSVEILRPSLWVYGMPSSKDLQRQSIDELYKFRFIIRAGCIVNDSIVASSEIHNKKTDSILSLRIGKNWRDRFEASVDSAFAIDSTVISIAKSNNYILAFDTTSQNHNAEYDFYPNLRYTTHSTINENIKMVTVDGYGVIGGKVTDVNYLRATVDLKLRKVINIEKTPYQIYP